MSGEGVRASANASGVIGAEMQIDLVALAPSEIPVGMVLTLVGAPFLIAIARRCHERRGSERELWRHGRC